MLRCLSVFVACLLGVGPLAAQSLATPHDSEAMDRALQQADGPRKRILEAARAKAAKAEAAAPAPAPAPAAPRPVVRAPEAVAPPPPPPATPPPVIATLAPRIEPLAPAQGSVARVAGVPALEAVAVAAPLIDLPLAPAEPAAPPPRLLSRVDPELPARLFRRGAQRTEVVLQMTIQRDGSVGEVNVLSGGNPDLLPPIVEAVRQWRYEPQPAVRPHSVRLVVSPG